MKILATYIKMKIFFNKIAFVFDRMTNFGRFYKFILSKE